MNELEHKLFTSEAGRAWEKVGVRHHHGIALPLFSIHTEKSCGIGEYLDLIPLISWCRLVGMDVIQLLPLNDNGLGTSPYSAISAFALNPVHLSLYALPHLELLSNVEIKLKKIAYWTQTDRVKHHIVRELKNVFFREYIPHVLPRIKESEDFKRFCELNWEWLEPYALFKSLKEMHYWKHWEDWPPNHRNPDEHHYAELLQSCEPSILFHKTLQYLCYLQLHQVKQHAEKEGILLKGDIPILINRDSAEVWNDREYFLLDFSAGAPPDMFSVAGQNWGFPLYDWKALELDHNRWWKRRLQFASQFYHIYRIDHIVGFFRIWSIPLGRPATEGHYFPEQSQMWIPLGNRTMKMMLETSYMLPIGEDLGAVPLEVKAALTELGICGTKVMRWERHYETDHRFIDVSAYPPISMTTVSTHDSDTLQQWWRHAPAESREYCVSKGWEYRPFLTLEWHEILLHEAHRSGSLFHINLLQEYLALFPELISAYAANERINIPGTILDTNWTYRFKPSVEEMLRHEKLQEKITSIIKR